MSKDRKSGRKSPQTTASAWPGMAKPSLEEWRKLAEKSAPAGKLINWAGKPLMAFT